MIISLNEVIWGDALIVTLLGFGLVFILLVLLVGIVTLFGKVMSIQGCCKSATKPTAGNAPTVKVVEGSLTEGELAAVAIAMHLCNGGAHIDDGHKLTIKRGATPSAWCAKQFGMNCM